jgi:endonuclease/exonuclease/phosphatase (EEP) superfamily protein YafD
VRIGGRRRSTTISGLIHAAAFVTALFSFATVFDAFHEYLELFAHFRLQYLGVSLILFVFLLLLRSWRYAIAVLATAALNAWFVVPWYLPGDPVPYDENRIKIVLANVHAENSEHFALRALLDAEQPDIAVLQEISTGWAIALDTYKDYPHRYIVPRYDYFGIAVLSRIPFESIETVDSPPRGFPTLVAAFEFGEKPLTLVSTHPMPPMTTANYDARNTQIASIPNLLRNKRGSHIVIGDLNTTMWGENYRRLIDNTGLHNVRKGYGVLPSWPTFLPFAMIPLDHCLVSADLTANDVHLGADIGSDHRPLILSIQASRLVAPSE